MSSPVAWHTIALTDPCLDPVLLYLFPYAAWNLLIAAVYRAGWRGHLIEASTVSIATSSGDIIA